MTDAEYIAIELARAYGLYADQLLQAVAFRSAVIDALRVTTADGVVAFVREQDTLHGLRNPYGGLIARIQKLPENLALRRRITTDQIERGRFAALGRAARRGETLAELIDRGDLRSDEVERMIAADYPDEDLRVVVLDALQGRSR